VIVRAALYGQDARGILDLRQRVHAGPRRSVRALAVTGGEVGG